MSTVGRSFPHAQLLGQDVMANAEHTRTFSAVPALKHYTGINVYKSARKLSPRALCMLYLRVLVLYSM